MTPTDDYAFVGDPRMFLPPVREVHVSCSFTWDIPEAERLAEAWAQYYPVTLGGCALGTPSGEFTPGMYIRLGPTFSSRGCNSQCPWCLVPEREGKLRQIEIHDGNDILDNNLLQCNRDHISKVIAMLRGQHSIRLSGGLDSRRLTDSVADDLRSLTIKRLFFACDTKAAIKPLERAKQKLNGFGREQLRCFVLLAFGGETISDAMERLQAVWDLGFVPFAMLYQPPDHYIEYSREWKALSHKWSRPAIMKALNRDRVTS